MSELKLTIYDNKIPFTQRDVIYKFCLNSTYKLGWVDTNEPHKYELNTYSSWSIDDLQTCGIYPYLEMALKSTDWFTNTKIEKIVVNLVRSDDVHFIHGHPETQVFLYYVNLDWQDGWYGETVFYNPDDINSIEYTSSYTPGRIILFDGNIPHAIRPQSINAPKYRFSLSVFYSVDKILK